MNRMSTPSSHHDTLVALELELVTSTCTANRRRVEDLLHDDFFEHGASGRTWTRSAVLDALPDSPHVDGACFDFVSRDLAPGVALLTYRIAGARSTTRSSIWVMEGARWQMLFHQGTLSAPESPHVT